MANAIARGLMHSQITYTSIFKTPISFLAFHTQISAISE